MHIIEYVNFEIKPTEEAFLIKPIRDLYLKDKSKTKEKFLQQLSIVYFIADPRSSYNYILNEEDRLKEIIIQEGLPKNYKITKELQTAINEYKKHIVTTSSLLLEDTRIAVDKVRQFLRNVDLESTDQNGKPIYTINNITSAIKQIPQLSKDLIEAEKTVAQEIEENGKVRGSNEKTLMDDGILI